MKQRLQIANIFGFILMITLNTLAVTLPLAGRTTGEISDLYPNLFVPAGYAFSIWSVIYILLLIFIIKQSKGLLSKTTVSPNYISTIGWWFFISCLANSIWIIAWHYLQIELSLLLMLTILGSLIMIYQKLGDKNIPFFVRFPFSVYLGWITVATVANVTALLVAKEWNGFGISEVMWTIIILIIASGIGIKVFWKRKDLGYIAVIIWALIAILVRRDAIGTVAEELIITILYLCLAFIGVSIVARFLRKATD